MYWRCSVADNFVPGSYTALLPYSRERYLQNHIMLSTVDKLHKVYSTDAEPVVWARTVGVEVLNELDSLKAAMMTVAGAQSSVGDIKASAGWDVAAKGLETLITGSRLAHSMSGGLNDALVGALKGFVQGSSRMATKDTKV